MIGDGQVSLGSTVVKPTARKVRMIGDGSVVAGFAGATADCLTLLDRLEKKIEQYPGQLMRSCVELAKAWRTERYLRRLEATLLVADSEHSLMLNGSGDVIEPTDGIMAIGSGGLYALSAARALAGVEALEAMEIAERSMHIAADMCVYTNHNFTVESIEEKAAVEAEATKTKV